MKVPSLSAVYDMTWREFHLRKQGWEREQVRKWQRTREIAYWSGAGTAFDGSKTKIHSFMKIEGEDASKHKPKISDEHRERFNKQMQEYLDKVKNGK